MMPGAGVVSWLALLLVPAHECGSRVHTDAATTILTGGLPAHENRFEPRRLMVLDTREEV
jgi:hypothetical protein